MHLRRGSEELLPIYQRCVFHSDVRLDSHWHVAQELAEHTIQWKRGAADVALFKGQLRELELYVLRYGAEVEVTPRPFDDFALVHMSLRGAAEIEADGTQLKVAEGRAAVIAPQRCVRLRWHAGTEQLIVKVPYSLMRSVCSHAADELRIPTSYLIPSRVNSHWELLVRSLLNVVRMSDDADASPAWLDHFERNVAAFLVSHQTSPASSMPLMHRTDPQLGGHRADRDAGATTEARRLDALLQYMESRLGAPVSLSDLANATGVGVRTLNTLCRRHLGETPMNLLRNMRLDAVRARLLLQPDLNITETALQFGFGHLGRFAAYYADRFGQLPRQTFDQEPSESIARPRDSQF